MTNENENTPYIQTAEEEYASLAADAVLKAGCILMESSAEVYRVEETMTRIGNACKDVETCEAYVTLTGAMVTITTKHCTVTKIARTGEKGRNLQKIDKINQLSRMVCRKSTDPEQLVEALNQIDALTTVDPKSQIFFGALAAVGFGIFFFCSPVEWLIIFVGGVLIQVAGLWINKLEVNTFLIIFMQSALIALFYSVVHATTHVLNIDKMMLADLMLLVPGLTLTNGLRDIISRNYLSGIVRIVEAILIGAFIVLGVAVVAGIGVLL